jgi:hypothetical protein
MPSPAGYFDDGDRVDLDPPPRGSPRLVGDMARLGAVRSPVDVRESPGPPLTTRQRKIRRKHLIILLARVNGLPTSFIADAFGLSHQEISRVCRQMGYDEL